jgi:hypothetical protein
VSECNAFAFLVVTIKMGIVVIVGWSIFEEDNGLLVKHLCVLLITFHVFKEGNMVFNLALSFRNVVRFTHVWQLVNFAVVVLESD